MVRLHGWTGYGVMGLVADKLLKVLRELVGWDLSTATFNGSPLNSYYVGTEDAGPSGVFFKDDGSKMYITGRVGATVEEYTLGTNWDVSTASLTYTLDISGQDSAPEGLFFKDDGSKMYVVGNSTDTVYRYGLGTDWDLSTASYDSVSKSVASQDTDPVDIAFGSSGSKMYVIGIQNASVYEYTLSPAWSITSASLVNTHSIYSQEPTPQGLFFSSTGDKMYVTGTNVYVYEYDLSTNWSLASSSVSYNSVSKDISAQVGTVPTGLFFRSNGEEMYVSSSSADRVFKYTIPTVSAWDVSSASYTNPTTNYFSVSTEASFPEGLFFKPDGLKMYVIGSTSDSVHEYTLSSAWDITSATFTASKSISTEDGNAEGVFFKSDGSKMYIVGNATDTIYEYDLSTNWSLASTVTYNSVSVSITADTSPLGLFFKDDGTKMYVVGDQNNKVYEYALSPAWDITSATSPSQDFSITQDTSPTDIFFGASGTKMYVSGALNDSVYEYDLSVAWDISSAAYSTSKSVRQQETTPLGLFFKSDGTKMYITGSSSDAVWSYDLG